MNISLGLPPNPKQMEFFRARGRHVAYGGARGGGKSWAMRTKLIMLAVKYPGIQMLLLRRTMPQLRENHIVPMLSTLKGIAQYKSQEKVFEFYNGSRIVCGYCAAETDALNYQGQSYDVIGMEEATQFTEQQMDWIVSSNRPSGPGYPTRMYYTCNPGGVGHAWVKRLFIDRDYRNSERPEDYEFIPAKVYDNYVLMGRDPDYVRKLENLPEDMRRAHLDGDWDLFVGQYFTEFRRGIHVVTPFAIPDYWQRYRAFDYGLDMLACYWAAFDELGNCYVYNEYCAPNLIISEAAHRILERTPEESKIECTFAPRDMWATNRATGKYQAEIFEENGLRLTPVSNGRVAGWQNIAEWLHPVPNGVGGTQPRLKIFSNCTELIKDLPLLQHDDKNPSDCATEPHDITHAPDGLRYLLDGRPRPAEILAPKDEDEPLEFDDQIENFMDYGG